MIFPAVRWLLLPCAGWMIFTKTTVFVYRALPVRTMMCHSKSIYFLLLAAHNNIEETTRGVPAREGLCRARACLDGDEARGPRVELRPVVREPREVFLLYDVVVVCRRRVETVKDDSDEQIHEHVRNC